MPTRGGAAVAVVGLLLAACGTPVVSPSTSLPAAQSPSAPASVVPSPTPGSPQATASATPTASAFPEPARPYGAPDILAAMTASRRPGGIPDQLETAQIGDAIAGQVWTYGGTPWPAMTIGGSCGPETCTLDVSGTPSGAAGEDLYTFSITPADGTVELLVADLHGYPAELDDQLDAIAREGVDPDRLAGLSLVGARWLPPPADGQFVLSYRSGGEEGSPALDVTVDLPTNRVLRVEPPAAP